MMAVEPGIDLLAVGEMGIANTTAAAALAAALFGGQAAAWVGPGTGVAETASKRKIAVVERAVALHRPAAGDGFDLLRRLGGRELAAMVGAIMAARMARVPVLLDGYAATAAAAALHGVDAARARPLPRRALLGRARPPALGRAVGPEAALGSRHAAR